MRRATFLIAVALCAAGCGGAADVRDAAKSDIPPPCPEGTPTLKAREVIGPVPRGYEVVEPGRPKVIEGFVTSLRKDLGKAYRSHDARVIVPRGQLDGTAVIVINTHEGRPEDVVVGAKSAEGQDGVEGERIDVDGREGRLQHSADGSTGFIAMAPTGRCSILFLLSDRKPRLEDAAALIGARG
jgi:hypothetical protein